MIDAEQVADPDIGERHSQRVYPERLWLDRIACRDVPGHALFKAEAAEQAESRRQSRFTVDAFRERIVDDWRLGIGDVYHVISFLVSTPEVNRGRRVPGQ